MGGFAPLPFGKVLRPPGAAHTQRINDFRVVKNHVRTILVLHLPRLPPGGPGESLGCNFLQDLGFSVPSLGAARNDDNVAKFVPGAVGGPEQVSLTTYRRPTLRTLEPSWETVS